MSLAKRTQADLPHYHVLSMGTNDERGEPVYTFVSFSPRNASISTNKCPVCVNGVQAKVDTGRFPRAHASVPLSLPGTARDVLFSLLDDYCDAKRQFDIYSLHKRIEDAIEEAEVGLDYRRPGKDS